jgi:Protein of unknown function (DUF1460)
MKNPQPRGLSRRRVEQFLSQTKNDRAIGSRIEVISRQFLGRPYQTNPLIGSADKAEVFTASIDRFDCVTYIETVIALARASTVDGFVKWLRKIRYERGRIQWDRRNHYMTLWIRNNVREGIVRRVSMAVATVSIDRVLNVVPGLATRRIRIRCVAKRAVPQCAERLRSGDVISFVSTHKHLDVFHAGIIVRVGKRILMRHASRSQGGVVEQELSEFLKANRMAGVVVVRPCAI